MNSKLNTKEVIMSALLCARNYDTYDFTNKNST